MRAKVTTPPHTNWKKSKVSRFKREWKQTDRQTDALPSWLTRETKHRSKAWFSAKPERTHTFARNLWFTYIRHVSLRRVDNSAYYMGLVLPCLWILGIYRCNRLLIARKNWAYRKGMLPSPTQEIHDDFCVITFGTAGTYMYLKQLEIINTSRYSEYDNININVNVWTTYHVITCSMVIAQCNDWKQGRSEDFCIVAIEPERAYCML